MGKKEKARARFEAIPADFTWKELCSLLGGFGYVMIKGKGSRRKFYKESTGDLISLHEPHPGSIVKKYVLQDVRTHLREKGELK
ncbi:type II toxin-antitoxin system HicA family toxin [Pontiellaceae bacterium B12219]|nr:type II toxin-antitoxin system HicA family toxin [Pontiellaceae bacterium B12219]